VCQMKPSPAESILLIGRSGTGKTTCLVSRMFLNYHKYWRQFYKSQGEVGPGPCLEHTSSTHILNSSFLFFILLTSTSYGVASDTCKAPRARACSTKVRATTTRCL
jgi:hypothetical protein